MNYTPDLFGDPPVAAGKTDTSREAAVAIQPTAATMRSAVLADVERCGAIGATGSEVTAHLRGRLGDGRILNARPRLTELKNQGWIRDFGKRRENVRGKNEIVWVAV